MDDSITYRFLSTMQADKEEKKTEQVDGRETLGGRLWFLFNEKKLDRFLAEYEEAQRRGENLAAISKECKLPRNLEEVYQEMKKVLQITDSCLQIAYSPDDGWKVLQIDSQCTMWVRVKGSELELRARGKVPIFIKNILYVAYLIKHYTECLPFSKQALDLKEPSKVEKIGFLRLHFPIPLIKDRSCLVRGIGINRIEKNNTICIFADGITDNKEYLERNGIDRTKYMKGRELLDLKHFTVELKALGKEETEFAGYLIFDNHMSFIPDRVVLFIAKEAGKYLFHTIIDKLLKFEETIWAKQIKEKYSQNAQFYDWINGLVDKWVNDIELGKQ